MQTVPDRPILPIPQVADFDTFRYNTLKFMTSIIYLLQ